MGRPLKEKTVLAHDVKVRLSDEAYEALISYCAREGREKAEVIREAIRQFLNISGE